MIHHDRCPLCEKDILSNFSKSMDVITGDMFTILQCGACGFLFTQDAPAPEQMHAYYMSERYLPHETAHKKSWMKLVRLLRKKIRLGAKVRMVERYSAKTPGNLLDAGCGNGEFAGAMQDEGWNVMGTESSETMRSYCMQHDIDCRDPESMKLLPSSSMDAVTMWHSLEHMHDLHGTMHQIQRLLASDGVALIALPNIGGPLMCFYSAHDVPRHVWHFRPDTFGKLAEMHGLQIVSIHPLRLDPLYMGVYYERLKGGWMVRGLILGLIDIAYGLTHKYRPASLVYILRHANAHSASS